MAEEPGWKVVGSYEGTVAGGSALRAAELLVWEKGTGFPQLSLGSSHQENGCMCVEVTAGGMEIALSSPPWVSVPMWAGARASVPVPLPEHQDVFSVFSLIAGT